MKKKKASPAPETETEERVNLKPVLGIEPRVYLAVLYSFALLCAFFFVFLYPGLSSPGSTVTFVSVPEGASIIVDGNRLGFTPYTGHVAAGRRKITIKKPHFESSETILEVENRLVGSLLFPKRAAVNISLKLKSPKKLLESAHKEFNSWTLTGEPSETYPFPTVLSDAVVDYYAGTPAAERDYELMKVFLSDSARSVDSEGAFKDFIRASLLAGSRGMVMTPRSIAESGALLARLLNGSEHIFLWLGEVLPREAASELMKTKAAEYFDSAKNRIYPGSASFPAIRKESIRLAGKEFLRIPAGTLPRGWAGTSGKSALSGSLNPVHQIQVKEFFLSVSETTEADFRTFLEETPRWKPANREALIREGLVEDGYLSSWNTSSLPPAPGFPVREVSYYAAAAYCDWLSSKNPGFLFFLPTETQWEWAASLDFSPGQEKSAGEKELVPALQGTVGKLGLRNMNGNVWEWCSAWYFQAAYIFPGDSTFPGAEKCVRGGGWLNSPGSVTVSTRGSQPPEWCTPYIGFRVAAVRK